jgi:TonB-linked SusC/RagA family outer membrane protein
MMKQKLKWINKSIHVPIFRMSKKAAFMVCMFFCLVYSNGNAQDKITGKVTDGNGLPISGASVLVVGTQIGEKTNFDGKYTITARKGNKLSFSYVGMKSQEVEIVNQKTIIIVLKEEITKLDEIFVVGYGKQKKSDLTGAISTYKPNENDGGKFSSVANLLQGRMAGVVVMDNNASPGSAASVRIRGASSFRGDNEPLYVVDNVPLASATQDTGESVGRGGGTAQDALASISPSDIERIEVLKDASSTAIYGSRGANGVVLITTKQGKPGKFKVSIETSGTVSEVRSSIDVLDLDEYASFRNMQQPADNPLYVQTANGGFQYYSSGIKNSATAPPKNIVYHDWQKELYNTSFSSNHRVNLSGGDDKYNFFIAAGNLDVNGVIANSNLSQKDFRLNLNGKVSPKVNIIATVNGVERKNNIMQSGDNFGGSVSSVSRGALVGKPYNADGIDIEDYDVNGITNIFSWLEDYKDESIENSFVGSLNLNYKISKAFTYELRLGGTYKDKERKRWFGPKTFLGSLNNGNLGISDLSSKSYTVENLLKYNTQIGKNINLNALVGTSFDDYYVLNELYEGNNFDIKVLELNGAHLAGIKNIKTPIQGDFTLFSYLSRVNLGIFKDKYLLTANFRADKSSKFQNDNQWGYFPSFAGAWKVHQEKFLADSGLSELKFRIGWGLVGNQAIAPYSTFADYSAASLSYSDGNNNSSVALNVNNIANKDLKWETTESSNIGLDFGFLGGRVTGTVDAYIKTTKDLLNSKDIPQSSGYSRLLVNQGSLQNKGVEFSLSSEIISTKDFKVSLGGNMAFNKSKILDLGLPTGTFGGEQFEAFMGNVVTGGVQLNVPANIFVVGKESALFWGYKTNGIIQENDPYLTEVKSYNPSVGALTTGGVKFVDVNGDGTIDDKDQTFIGNPNPEFTYGFTFDFKYKNVSLRTFFNGVYGNDILYSSAQYDDFAFGADNIRTEAYNNMWTPENKNNSYAKLGYAGPNAVLDRYLFDGSYLRLSDVTLTYKFPESLTKKTGISVDIFTTGRNLMTITNYKGYDPSVNSFTNDGLRQGIDFMSFPSTRSYTLGFNIKF